MESHYSMGLSKQAILVYKLLIGSQPLSAKEIGEKLNITPHSVYRLLRHLEKSGLVDQIDSFPLKYQAKRINEGVDNYLMRQRRWFSNIFNEMVEKGITFEKPKELKFDVKFIQNRDEHWDLMIKDINQVRFAIKYITYALPMDVPNEWIYAHLQAIKRGIDLKINALEHTKENHNLLMSYKHIGAQIKHGKSPGWHLYLFDDDIAYITMIDSGNKIVQTGVRFVHRGINRELQDIFNKYWQVAHPVE